MSKKQIILLVLTILLIGVGVLVYFLYQATTEKTIEFWGTIETEETMVIAEVSGQVLSLKAEEGQQVVKGDLLCELSSTIYAAQLEQAQSVMDAARAQLLKAEEGATEEDVAVARAQLEYAQAMVNGAEKGAEIAQKIYDFTTPKELQLEQAKTQLALATLSLEEAQKKLEKVQALGVKLPLLQAEAELKKAQLAFWQADHGLRIATATPTSPELLEAATALESAKMQKMNAEEQLKMIQAAGKDPEISRAEAAVEAAKIKLEAAKSARDYAARGNPAQLDQAEFQVQLAEIEVREAERQLKMVQAVSENYYLERAKTQVDLAQKTFEQAKAAFDALQSSGTSAHLVEAQKAYDAALELLHLAEANYQIALGQADPLELTYLAAKENYDLAQKNVAGLEKMLQFRAEEEAQVQKAQTEKEALYAQLAVAQEQLKKIEKGTREEDIDALKASLAQTEAALKIAQEMVAKCSVESPIDGFVLERSVSPGEAVNAGTVLFTIADLDQLFIKVYLAETDIGLLRLDQRVKIRVDAYPDRFFEGVVVYLSPKAQFTPKNVQTREQRTVLTFACKVKINDPDHLLRIGIPADVIIDSSN